MSLDEFRLNKEDFSMNMNDSYRLTDIKEVTIQLKDGQLKDGQLRNEITLNKDFDRDLYIRKLGNNYVIFQTSPSLDYSMEYLQVIKQCLKLSSVLITFVTTSKCDCIRRFCTKNIKLDIMLNVVNGEYDLRQYVTAIFIPIVYTDFDLINYVINLYMVHSGNYIHTGYVNARNYHPFAHEEFEDVKSLMDINLNDISVTYNNISSGLTSNMDNGIFIPGIEKVIFNDPATIVFWSDGSKTVVKTQNDETYDKEKGLSMAISKKMLGNTSKYYDTFKKWIN